MLLTDILTPQRVKVPLAATTKQGVIEELLDLLAADGQVIDAQVALQAVLQREKTRTTGIGGGVALPHGKCPAVRDLVMAVGASGEGIDFDSMDGKPVTVVMLLLSPLDKTGPHIQALARLSRLLSVDAFRKRLCAAQSPQELFEAIKDQQETPPVEKRDPA